MSHPFEQTEAAAAAPIPEGERLLNAQQQAEEPEYIDARTLAQKLSVSIKAVQKWTAARRIPCVKCGYHWRYSSLEINKRLLSGQLLSPVGKR